MEAQNSVQTSPLAYCLLYRNQQALQQFQHTPVHTLDHENLFKACSQIASSCIPLIWRQMRCQSLSKEFSFSFRRSHTAH
ncbi:hypothetical protein TanjilG_04558 [Lupinus angustifolius]|uniref:Uncharacterized protein n=1 Tax=Lupinus angustifolius TaxID=3871 RepID=A0A4P1RQW7_LUPAN|nr:hypothetical protein TanjilG_04558 [Lupinus angustifolius]